MASNFLVTIEISSWVLTFAMAAVKRGLDQSVTADRGAEIVGSSPSWIRYSSVYMSDLL